MRRNWLKWFFTFEGRVNRREYLVSGLLLAAVKIGIDWWAMGRFGGQQYLWSYDLPAFYRVVPAARANLVPLLWAYTIPFFWSGIALTTRRLRDAGRHPAWVCLFFVPLAKIAMFLWLVGDPGTTNTSEVDGEQRAAEGLSGRDRGVLGIVVAAVFGLLFAAYGTRTLAMYGWGLFLGIPFLMGFIASWFYNRDEIRPVWGTVWMSCMPIGLLGVGLICFALEGLICLLMVLPLALPVAIAGGMVARNILRGDRPEVAPRAFTAWVTMLPVMMFSEHAAKLEPPVIPVTTSIVIHAPVSVVWKNVISFPPLAAPKELIFRAGIAYPIAGQIVGEGPGAVRYCRFSTGDFVEPITTWDENHLLAFDVSAEPPSLRELSPWKISPPHVERNYMRSRHGQFRLVAMDDHTTLLEGTTWYQNYFWPQAYWREWSDGIVHRIHLRVLEHVKAQAEGALR